MEREGGAIHPSKIASGTSYTGYRVAGHSNCAVFDSEVYKTTAEDICAKSRVKLMYHLMFLKTDIENGSIRAAYFATKDGIYKIRAKVFIDCSGDADMAYACGVPMQNGDEVQSASLFFTVRGVDKAVMDKHMSEAADMEEKFYMKEIASERENGAFPLARAKIALYEGMNGQWRVNMTQLDNVDAAKPEQVTAAEIEGRRQIKFVMDFLKKYAAGCEDITLVESAPSLGVRESRRIVGEYTLTLEDISVGKKFEDSVFCCSNSVDMHKKGGVDYIATTLKAPYYIPYRSLIAKNIDNLLAAGRCASADRSVMAAIRVMPPCFAMGQAAGTAAAICAARGLSAKSIDICELINALLDDGVYLP